MKQQALIFLSRSAGSRSNDLSNGSKTLSEQSESNGSKTLSEQSESNGFTVVELIIVISIMMILLAIGTVKLFDSMANGRDVERKTDIETIANHLETFYISGNGIIDGGEYPSTQISEDEATIKSYLINIDTESLKAPDKGLVTDTFRIATNKLQTVGTVKPDLTIDLYVYQPLAIDDTGNWILCENDTQDCRKFNLYYKLESESTDDCIDNICMVTSKNQ